MRSEEEKRRIFVLLAMILGLCAMIICRRRARNSDLTESSESDTSEEMETSGTGSASTSSCEVEDTATSKKATLKRKRSRLSANEDKMSDPVTSIAASMKELAEMLGQPDYATLYKLVEELPGLDQHEVLKLIKMCMTDKASANLFLALNPEERLGWVRTELEKAGDIGPLDYAKLYKLVEELPGIEQHEVFKAIKMFVTNKTFAKLFLAIKPENRLGWVRMELGRMGK